MKVCFESSNEYLGFVNCRKFLDLLKNCQLLRNKFSPQSYVVWKSHAELHVLLLTNQLH